MAFLTEIFSRPRPQETLRYRAALAIVGTTRGSGQVGTGARPADFPRIARAKPVR